MRKILVVAASLILVVGCSSPTQETSDGKMAQLTPPVSCEQELVIQAFADQVEGSQYVPTDWQPSPGTDLYDIYEAGGIACTYGIQVAEVGGTVMWASNVDNLWDSKKTQWLEQGQVQIDLPGINETDAVILKEGSTSADEMHVWAINLLINDVWIQVGASFLQNVDEALPIIEAAVESMVK
jgi:uncharacterized protein YceK